MGYNTEFEGEIKFSREITVPELRIIQATIDASDVGEIADMCKYQKKDDDEFRYLDLELTNDFTGIKWDGSEKTYYMVTSLNVFFHAIRQRIPDMSFNGRMDAQGEEVEDVWTIEVKDGVARRVEVEKPHMTQCPECDRWFRTTDAETRGDRKSTKVCDAAPEMLELPKWVFGNCQTPPEVSGQIRCCILKAEGRA